MMKGEKGCDSNTPGIGDIAYVTDLRTGNIVTTTFRCSQFGLAHPLISKLGWVFISLVLFHGNTERIELFERMHTV